MRDGTVLWVGDVNWMENLTVCNMDLGPIRDDHYFKGTRNILRINFFGGGARDSYKVKGNIGKKCLGNYGIY